MPIPAAAKALVESGRLAHVATVNADGSPQVSCVWVGLDGDDVVFATLFPRKRVNNLRRDPRVSLTIEGEALNEIGMLEYLILQGTATVTDGGAPELLQRLARTYLGADVVFPPMPDPPPGVVVRISVGHVSGIGPWAS